MLKKMQRKTSRPNRRDIERYRRFAQAYLDISNPETYLNAEKSALKAGYSISYAHGRSYEMLDKVGIQIEFERIRKRRRRLSTIASPEEILEALTAIMCTLPNELMDEAGNLIPLNMLSRDQAQLIAGYKHKQRSFDTDDGPVIEDTIEYRLTDRLKAIEMIGRHHGIFEKDNRQKAIDPGDKRLVAFPLTEMSIEEWQAQVVVILSAAKRAQDPPALLAPPDSPST